MFTDKCPICNETLIKPSTATWFVCPNRHYKLYFDPIDLTLFVEVFHIETYMVNNYLEYTSIFYNNNNNYILKIKTRIPPTKDINKIKTYLIFS